MSLLLITQACAFASEAHAGQRRRASGHPYINHLLRVSHEAAKAQLSEHAIAAAILHDTLEDTSVTEVELRALFPERVVELVRLLTKWWPDHAAESVAQAEKPKYYAGILSDPEAVEIKLLDRADNLCDMIPASAQERAWAERYLRKTELEIPPLLKKSRNALVQKRYQEALQGLRAALLINPGSGGTPTPRASAR